MPSLRSSTGHLQISNTVADAGSHPASTTSFAYWCIYKINSDLAGVGLVLDATFDGGGDLDVFYHDGGDNNAYVATVLGGAANTLAAFGSRPPVGDWILGFLDQAGSGADLRAGWYNLSNPAGWTTQTAGGLTSAQASAFFNQGISSNSNPIDADFVAWRCAEAPLTTAQYLADASNQVSAFADVFDFLLTGSTSGDWVEQSGGVATVSTQGGTLSAGDTYVFASSDQEGFRFGVDDAAESSHTWSQAQDTDDTVSVGTARLIRALINGSGDLASTAYALRYQKNGSGGYVAVPVGSTVPASYGTVTFGAIGTGANGSTTVAPSYPAGITAGQYLTCHVSSGATNSETPTTPSGWTLLATGASTDGAFGGDTGPRRMTVFGKIAGGTESGTLTVSITNGNTCRGTIARWTKAGSGSWDVSAQGGNDSTSGTGFSATTSSINWNTGDCAIVAVGQRVDTATQSSQSLTASGVTFGTRTNRASTAVTTGNDHRHVVDTFAAVSATSNVDAAPTWAFTGSAACSGGVVVVRLREYTVAVANEIYIAPSSNIAGGGEATTARLTSPSGKTSSDFTTGRRWDDENGSDSIDIASDFYTELEWSINTQAPAVNGDYFDFRVYAGASALNSYTTTPRLTLGTAGGTICNPLTGIGGAAARPLAA